MSRHSSGRFLILTLWLTGVLSLPICVTAAAMGGNGDGIQAGAGDTNGMNSTLQSCDCFTNGCSVDRTCREKSVQSSYPEENDNRVWMLTAEGIQSNLIQYNRIIPGHKYIINNVGGRRLKFGPEDPPRQYVTILGEYDCVGPLAPMATLFPKAPREKKWWTHQTKPHEKWIFNAPLLEESADTATGFCVTVTDVETGKTAEVKIRVGTPTQF